MSQVNMMDKVGCDVVRNRFVGGKEGNLKMYVTYRFSLIRGGALIDYRENHNVVTSEGKQHLLSSAIDNGTRKTTWYVALVSNDGPPPSPVDTHVYDTFFASVVTEFQDYTSTPRITYDGVVSADKITNIASKASFTINAATKDVYGAALVSNSTKADHTGTDILMSWAALPGGVLDVQVNDVLNIEIELAFA